MFNSKYSKSIFAKEMDLFIHEASLRFGQVSFV